MIALISEKKLSPLDIRYHLYSADKSLVKQADYDLKRLQRDGWGVGYYDEKSKPVVLKTPNPIYEEKKKVEDIFGKINSGVFIAHVRYASNPKNLDKNKLIGLRNTQPFSYSNFIFSHNGTLSIVDEIFLNLGKYSKYVKGVNDSEVLFWNFIKHMDAYSEASTALEMMRDEIKTVWISVKKKYSFKSPYNGLNIFVSDSKSLFVLCDFKTEEEKYSIMTKGWEYGSFAYRKEKDFFIVSSEPTDGGNWNKMPQSSVMVVGSDLNFKINTLEG